eukprot:6212430-Pleurochrysis_carterae.AAC.1
MQWGQDKGQARIWEPLIVIVTKNSRYLCTKVITDISSDGKIYGTSRATQSDASDRQQWCTCCRLPQILKTMTHTAVCDI